MLIYLILSSLSHVGLGLTIRDETMRTANESQSRNDFKYGVFVTLSYIWLNGLWEFKIILDK